jgi:chemotaxis protein methyltransferase CheR
MNLPEPLADASALAVKGPIALLLRDLIQDKTGVYFEDDRLNLMAEKVGPRLAAHGCRTLLDYYYILKYEEKGVGEWLALMDAFSVQETYFWREFDQVRYLTDHIVPAWFKQSAQPLRIWSAACATGEEPFSIAMALEEAGWGAHPIEILASDASEAALAKARTAVYRERSFRALPAHLRAKYFRPAGEGFELNAAMRARVTFRWANLVNLGEFDPLRGLPVIFCRNVFIYFSSATITRVVDAFAERMSPRGVLMVGASESLLKLTDKFHLQEIDGAFAYIRNPAK